MTTPRSRRTGGSEPLRSDHYDLEEMLAGAQTETPPWTFLTNHAHVLVAISRDPEMRQRDIAHVVGITQGAVTRILGDLEASGCVSHERIGRRNRYTIDRSGSLRHPLESSGTVGDLLDAVNP